MLVHVERPARRTARLKVALALAPLVAVSWMGAYAAFTDQVDGSTTFSTGTIDLKLNGSDSAVAMSSLSASGILPGAVSYAPLTVSNGGDTGFSYSMATTASGDAGLSAALVIGVRRVSGGSCDSTTYATGTVLHTEAAGLGSAAVATRTLASGAAETLCFKVSLPSGAANSLQGKSSGATFSFTATS